jgi:hypothetical protein
VTRGRALLVLALAAALAPAATSAESVLIQPGPLGSDVAPYAFIPSLNRGQYDTAYAFSSTIDGAPHDFQYFVRFDLPPGLRGRVEYAYVWFYYGFGFEGFGGGDGNAFPGEIRCHPVLAPWDEDAVTWNSRPPVGPVLYTFPDITGFGTVFCKLTDLVQGWVDGSVPNYGIAVTSSRRRVVGMFTFEAQLPPSELPAGLTADDLKPSLLISFAESGTSDVDGDAVRDRDDNCPALANPGQDDRDGDRVGDRCDVCPAIADRRQRDRDGDGRGDRCGPDAVDLDANGVVDAADAALARASVGSRRRGRGFEKRVDTDRDGRVDAADLERWLSVHREYAAACGLVGLEAAAPLALLFARRRRAAREPHR